MYVWIFMSCLSLIHDGILAPAFQHTYSYVPTYEEFRFRVLTIQNVED